jgi:glutamate-1-semialdehyde 2,1-aminomutase
MCREGDYQNSGTEANLVSFRFARAYSGRNKIIKFEGHYHGWADEVMVSFASDSLKMMGPRNNPYKTLETPGQNPDVLNNIIVLPWNDLDAVEKTVKRQGHEIAAVILEPIMCNCEPVFPMPGYLEGLRKITAEHDIVLIFDEIITGFRLALGGAQEYYGVTPDLSTFGKACAAGYPLAGVAGKKKIMETGVYSSGTFNGNPICVAAGLATIGELRRPGVYQHLDRITKRLTQGVREIAEKKRVTLYCGGEGAIWQVAFGIQERMRDYRDIFKVNKMDYQKLRKLCLERGVRLHPSRGRFYTCTAHTDDDVERMLSVFDEVFDILF